MFPLRPLVLCFSFSLVVLGVGARARAQSCHSPDLRDHHESDLPFHATLGALVATYEHEGYRGDYEGLYTGFAYRAPWYGADVLLPAYRLDRSTGVEYGLGDLVLTLRGTAYRAWDGDLQLGVELPLMLPTGDADRELGMGHVMPMPAAFFSMRLRPWLVRASAGYGRMVGHHDTSGAGHHHHASMEWRSPLVNPMNRSELEHSLLVGLGLREELAVHARWFGAVPVADPPGVLRQVIGAGATLTLAWFDILLEVQHAVAGNAFDWKSQLQLGATF
jgi:hypothetical protein